MDLDCVWQQNLSKEVDREIIEPGGGRFKIFASGLVIFAFNNDFTLVDRIKEVAGVNDAAVRRVDGERHAIRQAVGDPNEIDLKGP